MPESRGVPNSLQEIDHRGAKKRAQRKLPGSQRIPTDSFAQYHRKAAGSHISKKVISCARRTQTPAGIPNGSEERQINSNGTAIIDWANPHHMGGKEKPSSKHVVPRYGGSV